MSKSLVIVESPAKARTIAGYLGDGYVVESSIGHIRDLPRSAKDVPEKYKKTSWARLGVDVENDFKPLYIVDPDKKQHISKLKKLLKGADELLLATDEDREGESIAWHLLEVLNPKVPVKRMVFHEITKKAIQHAIDNPREIDRRLVDAQEARRILDRLYGYEVSPVLWKKVMPRLSAGRVQSVATRIVVERERARIRFVPASYHSIDAVFEKRDGSGATFDAKLATLDGQRIATGKDFTEFGELKREDVAVIDAATAKQLAADLGRADFEVVSVERKPYTRKPAPPFMTSTLQQEASRKLRFAARRTMSAAQRLYESGYITYMRTDSTTLSETALGAARAQIRELYGAEYMPSAPRTYKNKVKNAQEAHEAIRPAGDAWKTPDRIAREVGKDEARLYELIWKRTIASQMENARGETLKVVIDASPGGRKVTLNANGRTITFPGFLRAYVEGSDDPDAELGDKEKHLPALAEGEAVDGRSFEPNAHETQPPARFTEASLVRALEELGVGRPSTYASIMGTIVNRGYVWKKGSALVPSFKAFAVVTLLEQHFGQLVDYAFTARMEDELDAIAAGHERVVPWLSRFYLGPNGQPPPANENGALVMDVGLKKMVSENLGEIDARQINSLPLGEDDDGHAVVIRVGRFGPYLERQDGSDKPDRSSIPEDLPPDELTLARAVELLAAPSGDRVIGVDPKSGEPVLLRAGRRGVYLQLGEASAERKEKPKTASLFKDMAPETVTLEQALRLLALPREVGPDGDGELILARNGPYGPFLLKGKDSRNLETEAQIFTITLAEAKHLFTQPKKRGRRRSAEPLKTLGKDPFSEQTIVVKDGRWGPYVTDGETNASLRTADSVEEITTERAAELLQMRRDRGPSKKKRKKRTSKKKKKTSKKKKKKKTSKKRTSKKKTSKKKAG